MRLLIMALWCSLSLLTSWGQSQLPIISIRIDCPPLPEVNILHTDTLSHRREESIGYTSMNGTWKFVELRGGWGHVFKTSRSVEMKIDKLGNATVSENGKSISTCHFQLRRDYNKFTFKIIESASDKKNKPFFNFNEMSSNRGYIYVCDEALIMGETMGDGRAWVFTPATNYK